MSREGRKSIECVSCKLEPFCGKCIINIRTPSRPLFGAMLTRTCCDCILRCEAVRQIEAH